MTQFNDTFLAYRVAHAAYITALSGVLVALGESPDADAPVVKDTMRAVAEAVTGATHAYIGCRYAASYLRVVGAGRDEATADIREATLLVVTYLDADGIPTSEDDALHVKEQVLDADSCIVSDTILPIEEYNAKREGAKT
jgi:hypothetical protein